MQATKVFVIEDPGTMASAVPCYRPRFPPEVRYSILVHNYDNIFSNEHSSPPGLGFDAACVLADSRKLLYKLP